MTRKKSNTNTVIIATGTMYFTRNTKIFSIFLITVAYIETDYLGKEQLVLAASVSNFCSPTSVVPSEKSHVGIEATLAHMVGATIQST